MLTRQVLQQLIRHKLTLICLCCIVLLALCALLAQYVAPYPATQMDLLAIWQVPSPNHLLGTDSLGRDILSRLLVGTRISLSVALTAAFFTVLIGLPLGLLSGFAGGSWDTFIMRMVDALYAFPDILLVIAVSALTKAQFSSNTTWLSNILIVLDRAVGGSLSILLALVLTSWSPVCRLIRGQTLTIRNADFILAAESVGSTRLRTILHHVLPNIAGSALTAFALIIPHAILVEAGLSFLGVGLDPPTPSWGLMIAEGAGAMRSHPYMIIFSALFLIITVFSFVTIGDSIRDAFDPKIRGE